MDKLLEKLTSYNLFNYLLPGIIFSILLEKTTNYSIIYPNMIIEAFWAYFIGLVISRIGSIIIEPLLKKIKFIKFDDYSDFVSASENDKKIELLSEENNMYRAFVSTFFILIIIILYEKLFQNILVGYLSFILISCLFILFLFSYKKQTAYIVERINSNKKKKNKNAKQSQWKDTFDKIAKVNILLILFILYFNTLNY